MRSGHGCSSWTWFWRARRGATTELLAVLVSWTSPRAVRTWKYGTLSCTILYLRHVFGVWVLFLYTEHWILREMTWSMGAMLGSTVDTYSALVLGWLLKEFHDFLRDWIDSVPEFDSPRISPCGHAPAAFPTIAGRKWLRSSSFSAVACSGGDWLILLVTMHFALCSLACRPFWVEEEVATHVVDHGSGLFSTGFAGIFAPRSMFPSIAGVPQVQEQIVEVVLHSTGGDQQHRVTDRGMQYHRSLGNSGGDSACAFHRGATDYGENLEVIHLVHLYCGADRGRVNAADHEGLLGFADFLGHLCQTQVLGVPVPPGSQTPGLVRHTCIISS